MKCALLLSLCATIVLAVDNSIDPSCSDSIDFFSYHIHVLFWGNNEEHTKGALRLRDAFIDAHVLGNNAHNCTMGPADPAPGNPMCVFQVNMDTSHSPFLTSEYAFFVPKDDLQRTQQWIAQHHGVYDVLIHPNTGCHVYDHTIRAMWLGNKWEIDTTVFHSYQGGDHHRANLTDNDINIIAIEASTDSERVSNDNDPKIDDGGSGVMKPSRKVDTASKATFNATLLFMVLGFTSTIALIAYHVKNRTTVIPRNENNNLV